jgi:hypothetical protein
VRTAKGRAEGAKAYQTVFLKDLLAFGCQLYIVHGRLPAIGISADFDAHGSSNDLVAEADTDDADAVLGEDFGRVFDEGLDPWRVVKRVVSLTGSVSGHAGAKAYVERFVLDPVIRMASISFRSG